MTQQEMIEQNVRLTIGELTVQIIVLKARLAELEGALLEQPPTPKPNGELRQEKGVN